MAQRFNNQTTLLSTTDVTVGNSAIIVFGNVIDTGQAIGGQFHVRSKLTTGAASQRYDVYAAFSEDGVNFDEPFGSAVGNLKQIGSISLNNETGTYRYYSCNIDPSSLMARYMKICLLTTSAAAGTIEANSPKVVIRSPK